MSKSLVVRLRNVGALVASLPLTIGLANCAQRSDERPIMMTTGSPLADGSVFLTPGGSYRMNTVRRVGEQPVLCSEPSPDWGMAVGTSQALAASVKASASATGSVSGSSATTEAITAMLGRTAGVVALRDGLYSACQAYANGIIGKDAYSLVLSQYGNLLVALAGSSVVAGGPSLPSSPPTQPVDVAIAVSSAPSSTSVPSKEIGTTPSSSVQVAAMQQEAVQALLVACINEQDPTVSRPLRNPLLSLKLCDEVTSKVATAVTDLLKPQSPGPTGARH